MLQKLKTYSQQQITRLLLVLNRWALPLLGLYLIALTYGSLSKINSIPKLGFSFDDKIYHFLAYAVLTVLFYNYFCKRHLKLGLSMSFVIATIYGIIIEGLQSVLTDFRTPAYFDVIANTLGAIAAYVLLARITKRKLN